MNADTFLIGYGTLLHRGSLGSSIGDEKAQEKEILPVIIRGYKRLFNLRPTHYESSFEVSDEPIENAAMNLEPSSGTRLNGLAFPTTTEELQKLDHRERYYERHSTPFFDFESGRLLGEGYIYRAAPDAPWIEPDPRKLLPRWKDIVLARAGAYQISRRFGELYDATTYLADGRTLMVDFYRDLLEDVKPDSGLWRYDRVQVRL